MLLLNVKYYQGLKLKNPQKARNLVFVLSRNFHNFLKRKVLSYLHLYLHFRKRNKYQWPSAYYVTRYESTCRIF
jgi:hypothetical protein